MGSGVVLERFAAVVAGFDTQLTEAVAVLLVVALSVVENTGVAAAERCLLVAEPEVAAVFVECIEFAVPVVLQDAVAAPP